ncbi:glycosyltransferase family 2 protein [Vibrio cholerae]|nr:glycosyltransferase family 2 protein [Vibrio cholerae]
MKLFISVVNHNHDQMIINNPTLQQLATKHHVILKSNTLASPELTAYCIQNRIYLLQGTSFKGFGANNNEVYHYAKNKLEMHENDFFLVLNLDVEITLESIDRLLIEAASLSTDIAAINLYRDKHFTVYDNSIRHYPKLLAPIKSLLGIKRNDIYDKSVIDKPVRIEWAAGSFLLFKAACYHALNGFDDRYFMYFEDADICTRANKNGFNVFYIPNIKAIHYASHQNRSVFSKHFIWYWCSSICYQLKFIEKYSSKDKGLIN